MLINKLVLWFDRNESGYEIGDKTSELRIFEEFELFDGKLRELAGRVL